MKDCESLRYEPLPEWTQEQMEAVLVRNDPRELLLLPLVAGLEPPDRDWALSTCIRLTQHDDAVVRGNAILGLGYLALTFKDLPEDIIRAIIDRGLCDSEEWVRGRSHEAAEELSCRLNWRFPAIE
jgi:hypothetical protein